MPRRIRVLQVMSRLERTGVETFLMHVLRRIDRERFEVDVAVHGSAPGAHEPEVLALGSRVFRLPSPPAYHRWFPALHHALRHGGGYDVVHAHVEHLSGLVALTAWAHGVPGRIVHCHGENRRELARARPLRRLFQGAMLGAIEVAMTRGLSCVEAAGDVLFPWAWGDPARTEVLYYPIDLRPYREHSSRAEATAALRRELGLPEGAPVLVHAGRFSEQKNHPFLLEVLAALATTTPEAHLLLLGDGPDRGEILARAERLGVRARLVLAGVRPDVPEILMELADAFVMPSRWEGLPLACMEAQAAGVPTFLSTAITPEACLVEPLVQRLDLAAGPTTWAAAIAETLRRPRLVTRARACEVLAASPVDIGRCVGRLEEIYRQEAGFSAR